MQFGRDDNPVPLGGPLPDRPWKVTGYGLGLMIGRFASAGHALGHSGAGPGSVSAVYHFGGPGRSRTLAAFMEGEETKGSPNTKPTVLRV